MVLHRDLMYIGYVICLIPLIPAAYGGRYRSTLAFILLYVLLLYTSSILTIVYVSYYTIVAYAICVIIPLYQYAYGTIL